eukprot:TRINITY_DN49655_c0_g1_i1.p1 TRINITY_DN49655_c0_g1~~TRINITY_DN49655_c0_g1_i1.p1  ORF type:complete len:101 (+),score=6.13 TRINITY_DN49655_c0_g1_i1:214-516(+)
MQSSDQVNHGFVQQFVFMDDGSHSIELVCVRMHSTVGISIILIWLSRIISSKPAPDSSQSILQRKLSKKPIKSKLHLLIMGSIHDQSKPSHPPTPMKWHL